MQNMLTVSMHRYGADETLRVIIDDLQAELHCCGADGFSDWTRIFWTGNATVTSRRHVAVPRSCCDRAAGYSRCVSSAPGDLPELLTAYKRGCNTVLRQHLRYMVHLPPQDICPQVLNPNRKSKGSPYSIAERRVPEPITVLGSQPAGDASHKPGGGLSLLFARPAVTLATLKRATTSFAAWRTEARWVRTVCLRLLPDSVAAAI